MLGYHRRACCSQERRVRFLWDSDPWVDIWTFQEQTNMGGGWGGQNRQHILSRRNGMYWGSTNRIHFSEPAGRSGEWDTALWRRAGVWSCKVLKFTLRTWICRLWAMRSHQKIFQARGWAGNIWNEHFHYTKNNQTKERE